MRSPSGEFLIMAARRLQGPALPVPSLSPYFSILQIRKASFCLMLGFCCSLCLECHSFRSSCGLAAHLSGLSLHASSSRGPPSPLALFSFSSNFLTLPYLCNYLLIVHLFLLQGMLYEGRNYLCIVLCYFSRAYSSVWHRGTPIYLLNK